MILLYMQDAISSLVVFNTDIKRGYFVSDEYLDEDLAIRFRKGSWSYDYLEYETQNHILLIKTHAIEELIKHNLKEEYPEHFI